MLRTTRLPVGASRLCLALALAALSASGCITPAKIASVEIDTTLPAPAANPLKPILVATAPQVADPAQEQTILAPADALPPPTIVTAQPLENAPAPIGPLVPGQAREALPPAPPPAAPPRRADAAALAQIKPIRQISLDITLPVDADPMLNRLAPPTNYAAEALPQMAAQNPFYRGDLIDYGMYDNTPLPPVGLDMCYQPLYFQELNAERYGRSWGCLQPAVSVVQFYGRIPMLPYMAFAWPARRCTYHAHWALPGYRIPGKEPYPIVISPAGGAAQAAAMLGVILLIP
ncbi:MAG TPA: hypothetical protein VFB80_03985 [Pirellulaceae bacterium]|nr:hypothetical protein [Pirellulaceae bacterium]